MHDFDKLEHPGISVRLIVGAPTGEEGLRRPPYKRVDPPFMLVDALPKSLRVLHLYDYVKGECSLHDEYVEELKEKMAERFPSLKEVKGLDEPLIGNSKYDENSGYDEEEPSEVVIRRGESQGLGCEDV